MRANLRFVRFASNLPKRGQYHPNTLYANAGFKPDEAQGVLGVPTRYIHAHSGVFNTDDYAAMLDHVLALVARLDEERVAGLQG